MSKISVVIDTFDSESEFLKRTIESVASQSRMPDELIIRGNSPESVFFREVLFPLEKEFPSIKYVENDKVFNRCRKVFEFVLGDYIKPLFSGDVLHPDALLLMENILDKNPDCGVVVSPKITVDEKYRFKRFVSLSEFGKLDGRLVITESLKQGKNILGDFSSFFFRKKISDISRFEINGFNIESNLDWYFWMYLASKSFLYYCEVPLVLSVSKVQGEMFAKSEDVYSLIEKFLFFTQKNFHDFLGISIDFSEKVESVMKLSADLKNILCGVNSGNISVKEIKKNREFVEQVFFSWIDGFPKQDSSKRPPISVVISVFDSKKYISDCFNSLLNVLNESDEIIFVDNSFDKTEEIIRTFVETSLVPVKFVPLQNDGDSLKVFNGILKRASGKILMFLSADTIVTDGMLKSLISVMEKEKVVAVEPFAVDVSSLFRFFRVLSIFNDKLSDKKVLMESVAKILYYYFNGTSKDVKVLSGPCFAVEKDVFCKLNEIDSSFFSDIGRFEVSRKLTENGYRIKKVPGALVYHYGCDLFRKIVKDKMKAFTVSLFEELLSTYKFGNIPYIDKLWGIDRLTFPINLPQKKYNFMFDFSGEKKDNTWYREKANYLIEHPKIAVVTVTYFSSKDIEQFFTSLKKSFYPVKIIVVDNSEDENEFKNLINVAGSVFGKERVKCCFSGEDVESDVVIIRNSNTGFAGGVNLGIKLARRRKFPFIWILNPDTAVAPNAAFELLKTSVYTGVPVVTCEIRDIKQPSKIQYNGYVVNIGGVRDRAFYVKKVNILSGSNVFCESKVFDKVGFLREDYFLYFEDNDFFERMKKFAIHPIYIPYTFILHKGGSTTGGFLGNFQSMYYFVRNMLYFFKEYKKIFPVKDIENLFDGYFHNRKTLMAIIEALYDFSKGVSGKKDFSFFLKRKNFMEKNVLPNISIDYKIEELRRFLLRKPRKKDKFFELLSLIKLKEILYG